MSTLHVLAFVGCWTPYLVISLWHVVDPESANAKVSPIAQDCLFLTAVFNSCLNPVVYGGFYLKAMRKAKTRANKVRLAKQSSFSQQSKNVARQGSSGSRNA